jgi:hypothetical protein
MTTENSQKTESEAFAGWNNEEEFLSLREIIQMVLVHKGKIGLSVLIITAVAAVFFLMSPRQYVAEGFLEVVPQRQEDGTIDHTEFGTLISSHLAKMQSTFLAEKIVRSISNKNISITSLSLQKAVNINRPRESDLIRVEIARSDPSLALSIVENWINEYLRSIHKNNISSTLNSIRRNLQDTEITIEQKEAVIKQLKNSLNESTPLINLSKGIEDEQLWMELSNGIDPAELKRLSQIKIGYQEQNEEYLKLKSSLINAEQDLAVIIADREFYENAEKILEEKKRGESTEQTSEAEISKAERYVNRAINNTSIIPFGEPAIVSAKRGALKKTGIVFIISLFIAAVWAFSYEWLKPVIKK